MKKWIKQCSALILVVGMQTLWIISSEAQVAPNNTTQGNGEISATQNPLNDPQASDKNAQHQSTPLPPIEIDRGDFTGSSKVVPQGSLQLEGGINWIDHFYGDFDLLSFPEGNVRYGLLPKTELRFGIPNYTLTTSDFFDYDASTFGDMSIGIRQQIIGPKQTGFNLAVTPSITIPTGGGAVSTNHVDPNVEMTFSQTLGKAWYVTGMTGFYWPTSGGDSLFTFIPTLALHRKWGQKFDAFVEYFGFFPNSIADWHVGHVGFTYRLTPNQMIDVHGGVGFTKDSPDYFVAAGYSFRINHLFNRIRRAF